METMRYNAPNISAPKGITADAFFDKIIWLLTTALFAMFYIGNQNIYGGYIMIGITGLILLFMFIKGNGKIRISFGGFHWWTIAFAAFTFMSSLWAIQASDATTKGVTIIEILICMTVLYWYYSEFDSTEKLLKAIMWGAYVVVLYTLVQYGVDGITEAVENEERFAVNFANINAVAMVASVASVINIHFWKRKIQRLSILFALPALLLIGASGSRKALIILLVGFAMIYLLDIRSKNAIMQVVKILVSAAIALAVVRLVLMLPIFKVAAERMDSMFNGLLGIGETDSSTRKRMEFIRIGWELFLENPFLGIGMDNAHYHMYQQLGTDVYTHNNYVEILSGGGFVGFLLYYLKYIFLLVSLLKAKLKNHRHSIAVITLLIILLVMDWGAVSYYSKQTYFYLMVYFIHLQNAKKGIGIYADQKTA